MVKRLLSRYRPRYIRSLVYMLQATEYQLGEYLGWFHRTGNFARVENRKHLVYTKKTRLLWLSLWLLAAAAAGLIFWQAIVWRESTLSPLGLYPLLLLEIGLLPYVLAYGIIVPLWLGQVLIQRPLVFIKSRQVRRMLRRHPALKIAVAGSYGKTTMREILKTVLGEGKKTAAPPASYNRALGIAKFVEGLRGDEEVLIFELGEYRPGDIKQLCRMVEPSIGVITGVNEAHLSQFRTLAAAAREIFSLARYLGGKNVYVNGEDDVVAQQAQKSHIRYSGKGCGGWKITAAETGFALQTGGRTKPHQGLYFTAQKSSQVIHGLSGLLGLHQVGPLSAAVAIGEQLGLTPAQIEAGLAKTKPFDHRMQYSLRPGGVTVIDDTYNGNPDGVRAAIALLKDLPATRRIYVTPGLVEMEPKEEEVHREIGRQLAPVADVVILIRNSVTPFIEQGLLEQNFKGELLWYDDALECYRAVDNLTKAGDVVILQNDWPDQYA